MVFSAQNTQDRVTVKTGAFDGFCKKYMGQMNILTCVFWSEGIPEMDSGRNKGV